MPPDFDAIVERVPCQPKLHIEVSSSIKGDTFSAGFEGLVDWAVLRKIVALILALHALSASTCGLVAMTSASHAEGRRFDPDQV